jgi:hypothetical protein
MKTLIKILKSGILMLVLIFVSCTKEGPQGDIGPVGSSGINGTDGTDGDDGEDGQDGNANVMVSDWFEPTESSFSVNNPRTKALPIATNVSSNIMEDGVILVYYDNDTNIYLLPRHTYAPDGTTLKSVDSNINRASRAIYVTIRRSDSDLNTNEYLWDPSGPAYGKGVRFRYVIIPSNASGKSNKENSLKSLKEAGVDINEYHSVMDYFGSDH